MKDPQSTSEAETGENSARALSRVFQELGMAVLERDAEDAFHFIGAPPDWFFRLFEDARADGSFGLQGASLFLDNFLIDAASFWESGASDRLSSGPWTEEGKDGTEWTLEATALRIDDCEILLISAPQLDYESALRLLQTSREQDQDYQLLLKEIEKRQVLLHCIIHDLSNPLVGIKGGLQLMEARNMVAEEGRTLLEIALRQSDKMQWLIRSIMHVFSDDAQAMIEPVIGIDSATDMAAVVRDVAMKLSIQADMKAVRVDVAPIDESVPYTVVGEERRLERVVYNLVDNALRFSPPDTRVLIEVADDDGGVIVSVSDQGPGVNPKVRKRLFQRFATDPDNPGQAGLGLHYCSITVEGYGGTIGYDDAEGGGAKFWIRLQKAIT